LSTRRRIHGQSDAQGYIWASHIALENILGVREPAAPPESSRPAPVGRRLSVNVALDVGEAIDMLAKRHRTTITDVIRRAISTYKFIDDEVTSGGKILVERNGAVREVTFL